MIALKSIAEEYADAVERTAGAQIGDTIVHLHHEQACEARIGPIINRLDYIRDHKPKHERALRLRLIAVVPADALAEYNSIVRPALAEYDRIAQAAWAEYDRIEQPAWDEYIRIVQAAHPLICSVTDCPWNGRTIFPKADR